MNEQNLNNKKFDLSQNSFVIFVMNYAPRLITGAIAIAIINSNINLPDLLEKSFYLILFIAMLIKAIMALQLNKRTLIITDQAIEVFLKKRKNNILLTQINNDEIAFIKQFKDEAFVITKKNGQEEIISISCYLKPYKAQLYNIKRAIFEVYGDERTDFKSDSSLLEYINKKTLPKLLQNTDNQTKAVRILLTILYMFLAIIPTVLALLALLLFILTVFITFLQGIIATFSLVSFN